MTQALTYQIDRRLPVAVVRLCGELTPLSSPVVRSAMVEALTAEPTAVVMDLTELVVADEVALTTFPALADLAAQWPGAKLLLGGATPAAVAALDRMAVSGLVPVLPTVRDALDLASRDPVPLQAHQRLEPTVDAPRIARDLAHDMCQDWGLAEAATPATIVSSELVTNAVRHAGTTIHFTVTLRDGQLRISVRDGSSKQARMQSPAEFDDFGRGLLIVDSLASAWGSVPSGEGKTVWAALPATVRRSRGLREGHDSAWSDKVDQENQV